MKLEILKEKLKVIKLKLNDQIPKEVWEQEFYSVTKTDEELSIVIREEVKIPGEKIESNWKAIRVVGVLDFSLTGILFQISQILAQAKISIFAISTYNTDYILLKEDKLEQAIMVLKQGGYSFL